ncbi:MAG: acyltransferase [Flavobacteriaceae bacterium]
MENQTPTIKPLTSLRFVFAFMVFVSHLSFLKTSGSEHLKWLYEHIFYEGYIGVSFFFILSGFILSYNYQELFSRENYPKLKFYIARIARIYPVHLLTLTMAIPLSWHILSENIGIWFFRFFANLTLVQSFIPIKAVYFSFNGPSWSIVNEMFFYLLFPFIILGLPRLLSKKYLILALLMLVPLSVIIVPEEYFHFVYYINPFVRTADFLMGILLYNLYKYYRHSRFNYNFLEYSSVFLLLIFYGFHSFIPQVARFSFYYWLPICYLLFSFSFQKGQLSRLLSHKSLMHLGEISFGFYMFHQLVIRYFVEFNNRFFQMKNDGLAIGLLFLTTLLMSHFCYVFFEKPFNKKIKNYLGKKLNF